MELNPNVNTMQLNQGKERKKRREENWKSGMSKQKTI